MVSNQSSIGQDLAEVKNWAKDTGKKLGQAVGLVDEDVIPGDPAAMAALADQLGKLSHAFETAAQAFKKLDTGGWHGEAADGFKAYLDTAPQGWHKAADAFERAGHAVAEYARVLGEMKPKAEQAKADLEKAKAASDAAVKAHNKAVDTYNAQARMSAGGPAPAPLAPFHDPGAEAAAHAQDVINRAKAAVQDAAHRAAGELRAACKDAPAKPGWLTQLWDDVSDYGQAIGNDLWSMGEGLFEAGMGMSQMIRLIQPLDPYYALHPEKRMEAMATMACGLVNGVINDPYGTAKTIVDVDGWKKDPAKAAGKALPDAIMSIAGGVGTAKRVMTSLEKLRGKLDNLGESLAKKAEHTPKPDEFEWKPDTLSPRPQPHQPMEPAWNQTPHAPEPPSHPHSPEPHEAPGHPHHEPEPTRHTHEPEPARKHEPHWDDHHGDEPGSWLEDVHGNREPHPDYHHHEPETPHHPEPEPAHHHEPEPAHREPSHDYQGNKDFEATPDDHKAMREILGDDPHQQRIINDLRESNPDLLRHHADEEIAGMKRYTEIHHTYVNEALRSGDAADLLKHEADIRNTTSGLNKLPDFAATPEVPQVYRGIKVHADDLPSVLERYTPGQMVEEKAFTSADKAHPYPGNVQFVIEPKHAKDMEFLNPHNGMKEVGWAPGNRFEVMRREYLPETDTWQIHMVDHGR